MSTPQKQMILDFGQKNIGLKQCKECGMVYDLNDKHDLDLHQNYHKQKDNILKFNGFKNEKIVKEYLDGRCIVIEPDFDSKIAKQKAEQMLKYVDTQLGIRNQVLSEINSKNESSPNSCKYYLFIHLNRIIGFCLAETISKAFKIKFLNETTTCIDKDCEAKAVCGISRIWVDAKYRRMKIASKLLDCVRINFLYYQTLSLNDIAFSDPTENGRRLACSYFKTNNFLVYENSSN